MDSKERYLQFPLFLLRDFIRNKEKTINRIFDFGIFLYSTKFSYQVEEVAKQLIYDYYSQKLPFVLQSKIESIESEIIGINRELAFASDRTFQPFDEIQELLEVFETDEQFLKNAIEYYQVHLAFQSIGITGNIETTIKGGKEILKMVQPAEPLPMVNKKLLFDFRDNEKSEFDLIQFLTYIAIKSILGKRTCVKTNKMHIICRMFGYSSCKHLPKKMPSNVKELFSKYSHRYHIDRVIQSLELNWNVLTYSSNLRGIYVAMGDKINLEELVLIAETKKQKNRIEKLKQNKIAAKAKVLQQLNKEHQLK